MVKLEEIEFIHLLYIGIMAMLLLAIAVVFFVVLHQRKAHLLHAQMRQQELAYHASMLQAIVTSQETERERIARDLHDEIGASLAATRLFVNQVQYGTTNPHLRNMLQQASQILSDTLQNVRHIVQNLSPALLTHYGFCRAVTTQAARLRISGLQVDLQLDEAVEHLDATAQLTLYRIVQELLTNIGKHAQAQCVMLHLRTDATSLILTAIDDGCGFVPNQPKTTTSMGLAGIQARTRLLGGRLELNSVLGSGTCVTLYIPR